MSAQSFTGPCTGGLKGGWGKKVGRAVEGECGERAAQSHTQGEAREDKNQATRHMKVPGPFIWRPVNRAHFYLVGKEK